MAQEIEALGALLGANADEDSASLSLQARSDVFREAFDIMADAARNPTFADEELRRVRQQSLDDFAVAMTEPSAIAEKALTRAVFGEGDYGGVATPNSMNAIARSSIREFHRAHWRPENAVLALSGDLTSMEARDAAARVFGDWSPTGESATFSPALGEAVQDVAPRRIAIDLPGAGQAAVAFGLAAPPRPSADYFPAQVAANVLGGGYSSRLNAEIRVKRGLSYGAGAGFAPRRRPALMSASAQTRNDAAVQVARLIQTELERLCAEPVDSDELAARKTAMTGRFGRSVETTAGVAGNLANLAFFDLPLSFLARTVDEIENVGVDSVLAAAQAHFNPARAAIVIVGDAKAFFDEFQSFYPDAELISSDAVSFDTASLT